jgi:hypothetical protein
MLSTSSPPAGHLDEPRSRIDQILERAAAYYEAVLWEESAPVHERLTRQGVAGSTLREFQVGYAPGNWSGLLEHLGPLAEEWDLIEAGIARPTQRGRLRVHFRSRVMFPARDRDGRILGFIGMATSPGPSWAEWVTSPDGPRYSRGTALFGIDSAAQAIARAHRAVVLTDCLDVLRLRQEGRDETVAVIRSRITDDHVRQLASALGAEPDAVELVPGSGEDLVRATLARPASGPVARPVAAANGAPGEPRSRTTASAISPDRDRALTLAERVLLTLAAVALGVGIPLGWVAVAQPDPNAPGGAGTAFIGAAGGVVATYVALALVAAVGAGWVRSRSRARRMRAPWARGVSEWQPEAWTYHRFEEVLIGAALVSVFVCMALFVAVGGFGG